MRRSAANQASISLFPFLAVLICTMGALVLLLLGLTQSMRHRLSRPAAPTPTAATPVTPVVTAPPPPEPRAPAPESPAGYDHDALRAAREREHAELAASYAARVAAARDELARLQTRLDELRTRRADEEARAGDLATQGEFQGNRSQAARVALELAEEKLTELDHQRTALRQEIALTERRLADLQARQSTVSNEFAIVPYEGRSGTQRRPIAIECTDQGFRFLPEQVLVGAAELRGGTARVNALVMGTRALLRYWTLKHAREPARNPKPYVLLLVRPSGIYGYDAARQLLAGLETSFGYELIDEKLPLASPTPDPQAVAVLKEAIQLAVESGDPAALAESRKQIWDEDLQRPVEQGRRTTPQGGRGAPGEHPDDRIDAGGSPVRHPVATTPRGGTVGGGPSAGHPIGSHAAQSSDTEGPESALAGTGNQPGRNAGTGSGTGTGSASDGAIGPEPGDGIQGGPTSPRGRPGLAGGPRPPARPATLGGGRSDLAESAVTDPSGVGGPSHDGAAPLASRSPGAVGTSRGDAPPARLPPPGQSPLAARSSGTGGGSPANALPTGDLAADALPANTLQGSDLPAGDLSPGTASSGRVPVATADPNSSPGSERDLPPDTAGSAPGTIPGSRRPPLVPAPRPTLTEPVAAPGADTPGYAEIPESPLPGGSSETPTQPGTATAAGRGSSDTPNTSDTPETNPFLREITPETPPLAASQRPQAPGRPRRGSTNSGGQGRPTNERSPITKPDPNDPLPAGPGGGGPGLPMLGGKRGGGPQRNLIGLERKIRIRVEPTRVLVGEEQPIEIVVKRGMKSEQLVGQVTSAMGQVVENWGPPPARFYWIPAVRFEVTREGNAVYERLRGAFERNQVKSSVDYVTPAGQTVEREDR